MQKSLRLKVQRVVDIVLGPIELISVGKKNVTKDVACPDVLDLAPDGGEKFLELAVTDQPLPVKVIVVDVLFKVLGIGCAILTPRVATKELITATAGKHHLNEFASKLCSIIVGVALPYSGLL